MNQPGDEPFRQPAYKTISESGWLTEDVYANARIWRAVEAALDAMGVPK